MLRFTIRDVLWLTVVVALGVGWVLSEQRAARLQTLIKWHRDRASYLEKLDKSTTKKLNELLQRERALEALNDASTGTPPLPTRRYAGQPATPQAVASRIGGRVR
jgi:hypothetical protein